MTRASIRIANRMEALADVAKEVDAFGDQNSLPRSVVNDLNVALDEVLNNIISYAYADDDDHLIAIELSFDGAVATVAVSDDGVAFDPLQAPCQTLGLELATRRVGGVGIHLVRNLMDGCHYSRTDGRNVLTLTKRAG
jgi:anti-sigma regulatory factor (Ser/Thr protein kinase)